MYHYFMSHEEAAKAVLAFQGKGMCAYIVGKSGDTWEVRAWR